MRRCKPLSARCLLDTHHATATRPRAGDKRSGEGKGAGVTNRFRGAGPRHREAVRHLAKTSPFNPMVTCSLAHFSRLRVSRALPAARPPCLERASGRRGLARASCDPFVVRPGLFAIDGKRGSEKRESPRNHGRDTYSDTTAATCRATSNSMDEILRHKKRAGRCTGREPPADRPPGDGRHGPWPDTGVITRERHRHQILERKLLCSTMNTRVGRHP